MQKVEGSSPFIRFVQLAAAAVCLAGILSAAASAAARGGVSRLGL